MLFQQILASNSKAVFASIQESLQNRSKSARRAHTSHTCPSHRRISKPTFEKTSMSRDRVQSIAFWEYTCHFRWGFAVVFESTTEPQREAHNDLSECRNLITDGFLQCFSNRAHKMNYRTADFRGRGCPRAKRIDKTRGLENTCAPNPKENTILNQKRSECERAGGGPHGTSKNKAFERSQCRE